MHSTTTSTTPCPLCNSQHSEIVETVKRNDLVRLYQSKLNLDVKSYVTSDVNYVNCKHCDLGFFEPCPTGDAVFYEKLQSNPWYYMDEKPEYDLVLDFISKHVKGSILEIGGGSGQFARRIGKDINYTGLEFNELAISKARMAGIQMHKLDLTQYIKEYRYKHDCVVSFQVLEHIMRPNEFIKESLACLKPNGYLVIAVPNNDGIGGLLPNIPLDLPPHHATHWSGGALKNLEKMFDIELVNIFREGVAPQHVIAAKKYLILVTMIPSIMKKKNLIRKSLNYKFIDLFASILARFVPVNIESIYGHTIVAIYRNGRKS
jgi:2-polyprenyl-3-methyl-5-hydroxy-6-metoxy-1,4-benzoquinol methylase